MSTDPFTYTALPMRVAFGQGVKPLREEVRQLGIRRVVVICTPDRVSLAHEVALSVSTEVVGVLAEAVMHVPVGVVDDCEVRSRAVGCDGYLAVGGGSAIGLAKALALRTGAPIIAVPTNYAVSEMTPVWGMTENKVKRTGRDRVVLPRAVVYDPALTTGLPVSVSVTSGMNAIAHAVEGLYAPDRSPIVSMMAREGARSLASALPRLVDHSGDLEARGEALYGAWLCGAVLGGSFDLPHAQTHAIVLPHVLAFNAPFAADMVTALAGVFGEGDPWTALRNLQTSLPMPLSLGELGFDKADIAEVTRQVTANPYHNPRHIDGTEIDALLERAWAGLPPRPSADSGFETVIAKEYS